MLGGGHLCVYKEKEIRRRFFYLFSDGVYNQYGVESFWIGTTPLETYVKVLLFVAVSFFLRQFI